MTLDRGLTTMVSHKSEVAMFTKKDILKQLHAMRAPQNSIVLMHSSLRSVGAVEGGAEALLDTLIEYFTKEGGLFCVPTHTWDTLGKDCLTLDMLHPTSNLGALSVIAANRADGIRSENPCHSMMVFGDRTRAETFVADEPNIATPTAPNSCYGKLYTERGYVLLVGVSQAKNTFLHTVDEILCTPDRLDSKPIKTTVRRLDGSIVQKELLLFKCSHSKDISERFPKYDTAFRYHGAITDGFIGHAPVQLCDAVKMKETVELILKNSNGKDPLCGEGAIPPKWYCTKE